MRNRLKEKGLSIRELSKRVDLPYNTVYAIFKGQSNIDGVRLRVYKKIVNELWKGE
ncbi:putative transcriptional regulator [Staphylococcus phage CUB-EPI_14]|nr:putative transcriptional regulator [Staphylococcus phage CUB-EPI_14]DAI53275.1 MAG TPA: antitoxin [Caudoviricetes sp.]